MNTRLSLWAMPSATDAVRYRDTIERLSLVAESAVFAPHVTLIGSMLDERAAADAAAAVAAMTAAFDLTFDALADSDERFRCVTLTTPATGEIVKLRDAAATALGIEPKDPYEPHLSLVYAKLHEAARQTLKESVDIVLPHTARIDAISVVTITDDIREWNELGRWSLRADEGRQ